MLDNVKFVDNKEVIEYPLSEAECFCRHSLRLACLLLLVLTLAGSPQKAASVSGKLPAQLSFHFVTADTSVTGSQNETEVTFSAPVVSEPQALPPGLQLGPKCVRLADRVMARLVQSEAHEANTHFKSDYRQSWITLSLAMRGVPDAFVQASYAMYGVHPSQVWERIVAERKARLGAEYHDWYTSSDLLRPDVPKISPATAHRANGADSATWDGSVGPVPHKEVV